MGYDTVRLIEHLPNERPDALGVPDGVFVRPTVMVVFDAVKDEMIVVTPVYPDGRRRRARRLRRGASSGCAASSRRSTSRCRTPPPCPASQLALPEPVSNTTPAEFMAMVDARQGVHRRRRHLPGRARRSASRAPFTPAAASRSTARCGAPIPRPSCSISTSAPSRWSARRPEILVRVRDGEVTIRPLAGTRRRGATPEEDKALEARAAGRPQGARRAPDAARPRPQRRRPRRRDRHGARHRELRHRALQPRHAHRQPRRRPARPAARRRSTR